MSLTMPSVSNNDELEKFVRKNYGKFTESLINIRQYSDLHVPPTMIKEHYTLVDHNENSQIKKYGKIVITYI